MPALPLSARPIATALVLVLLTCSGTRAQTIVWRAEDTGTAGLTSVVGFPNTSAVAVGPGGTVVQRSPEGAWSALASPAAVDLYDVDGPSTDLFAVAGDGYVGIFDDGAWIDVLTDQPLDYTPVHLTPGGLLMFGVPGQFPSICRYRMGIDSQPLCLVAPDWVLGLCGDGSPLTAVDRSGDVFTVSDGLTITPVHDSTMDQGLAGVDFADDCGMLVGFRQPTASVLQTLRLDLDPGSSEWEELAAEVEQAFFGVGIEGRIPSGSAAPLIAGANLDPGGGDVFGVCSNRPCTLYRLPEGLATASDLDRLELRDLLVVTEGPEAFRGRFVAPDLPPLVTEFDELPLGSVHGASGPPTFAVSPVSDANQIVEAAPGDHELRLEDDETRFSVSSSSEEFTLCVDAHLACVEGGLLVVRSGTIAGCPSDFGSVYVEARVVLTCEMTTGGWRLRVESFSGTEFDPPIDSAFLDLPAESANVSLCITGDRVVVGSDSDTAVVAFVAPFALEFEVYTWGFGVEGSSGSRGGPSGLVATLERLFFDAAFFADGFESGDLSAWSP